MPAAPRATEMQLRARTRLVVRRITVIVAASAVFGGLVSWQNGSGAPLGMVSGVLIALIISVFEILLQEQWAATLRRWPLGLLLLLRTAVYGGAFFVAAHAAAALLSRSWEPILHPSRIISNFTLLISFAFSFLINFALMLRRLLGPSVFASVLTGRYRRPRKEQRIVLFMDLRGSTQLAEKLGDERFHRFLNEVFLDITDPVLESGGDIYRYVGDEIIVTWAVTWPQRGARNASCVECVFAVEDALAARRAYYLAEFGTEPRLRAALHAGPLIVGEMGDLKREIVMLGDTMNTSARIENVCRAMAKDVIASAAALRLFPLPAGVSAESLGAVPLRGKSSELELFALARRRATRSGVGPES
jgi:adenylate cyclase